MLKRISSGLVTKDDEHHKRAQKIIHLLLVRLPYGRYQILDICFDHEILEGVRVD